MLSFAIDPSKNVMTPKDPSVTSVGSQTLSAGDVAKMQCLYNCDGTNPGTCGGHTSGESGVVESSGTIPFTTSGTGKKKVCKWLVSATSGDAIEVTFKNFNVRCGKGELRIYDGKDDTDNRPLPSLLTSTICSPETAPVSPSILISSSLYLYIVFESEDSDLSFKFDWKAVTGNRTESPSASNLQFLLQ